MFHSFCHTSYKEHSYYSNSNTTLVVGKASVGMSDSSINIKQAVVTPEKAKQNRHPSLNQSPVPKQSSGVSISVEHVIYYVTTWLQSVLRVKQLRNVGIRKSIVKSKSRSGARELETGKPEVRLDFESSKSGDNSVVVVVVTLANVLAIQKHNDLKCTRFVTFANAIKLVPCSLAV